jgi:DNA-binding MurR/RpiR family transcriptional regulator
MRDDGGARTFIPAMSTSPNAPFEQDFHVRATEARGRLSANDERIIQYLREHMEGLPFHTSDSLAEDVGVSRAAIVRFATKLGYDGFTEMRNSAREELRSQGNSPLTRFASDGRTESSSLLSRKLRQDIRNIEMTETLAGEGILAAADALAAARWIYVVGNRKSFGLAVYLHRILHGVRPNVRLVDPGFTDEVAALRAGDALIACLFQRYSRSTIATLDRAKEAGSRTVLITDGRGHGFAEGADHVLVAATDSPTLYQSMVAPLALLEGLAAQVAALDPDLTRRSLESTERFNLDQGLVLE